MSIAAMESLSPTSALYILLAGGLLFLLTRDAPTTRHGDKRPPPVLPSGFPLLGHLVQFLRDTQRLLTDASTHFGPDTPVQLKLLNRRMVILNGASNIVALFKGSRWLSSERWLVQVLVNAFGVDKSDAPFYLADDTGVASQPAPQSAQIPPEHRIFHLVYQSVHDGLSGERLDEMTRQFMGNLSAQFAGAEVDDGGAWTDVADLYGTIIRKACFTASMTALCGTRIFEALPDFEADFWEFDGHLPNLFREMPRWLVPSSYAARDRMKESMKTWHRLAHEGYDISCADTDARNWEENFGSKLMRTRHAFFSKMPLSKDTIAADDLGLLWAATANSIPAIGWMILETLQRPALLERVRAEIAPFMSREDTPDIDLDGLCRQPLVQSIYAEVLRVHNGTVVARVPQRPDYTIAGWRFPKDEPIMVSTFNTARVPSIWNQGTPDDPHPVDDFWPERFIVDPADAASGPALPRVRTQQAEAADGPYFSLDGTNGAWLPYGGGSRMCPGRHFAKKEMIGAMAMFLAEFDVEMAPRDSWVQHDLSYFMFGVMHPKGPVAARVRRRGVDVR